MADVDQSSVPVLAVTAAVGAVVLLFVMICGLGRKHDDETQKQEENSEHNHGDSNKHQTGAIPKKKEKIPLRKKESKSSFNHPWLAGSLKQHGTPVLGMDFSPNGKHLATCAEDRTILIWNVKDFFKREHKSSRANVEFDHATQVAFSPDSKAFIVSLYNANAVRVMKIGKKEDGSLGNYQTVIDFPKQHDAEIINIGIASNGRWIMTCSKDTTIKIWTLKGEVLSVIDTHQMNNSYGAVSPCGRFVGSSGFTPDVKVWEVCFDKSGGFKEVTRAFELKGHTAGVYCFSFSNNSHRMATVSKDGTWKVWNTNVEYHLQQDAKVLQTGQFNHVGPSMVALAPNAMSLTVTSAQDISFFNALTAQCEHTAEGAHNAAVTSVQYDPSGQYVVTSGDKHVHVFHNVVGYRALIADLAQQLKKATTQAMKERIQLQTQEARDKLKAIDENKSA